MKSLVEALREKKNAKRSSKKKTYIFVPGNDTDEKKMEKKYNGFLTRDERPAYILDDETAKKVNDLLTYKDKNYWYVSKFDDCIEMIKQQIFWLEWYDFFSWKKYFVEIPYTEI